MLKDIFVYFGFCIHTKHYAPKFWIKKFFGLSENAFQNVVCQIVAILSCAKCVNKSIQALHLLTPFNSLPPGRFQ